MKIRVDFSWSDRKAHVFVSDIACLRWGLYLRWSLRRISEEYGKSKPGDKSSSSWYSIFITIWSISLIISSYAREIKNTAADIRHCKEKKCYFYSLDVLWYFGNHGRNSSYRWATEPKVRKQVCLMVLLTSVSTNQIYPEFGYMDDLREMKIVAGLISVATTEENQETHVAKKKRSSYGRTCSKSL